MIQNNLEEKVVEIIQSCSEKKIKRKKRNDNSWRDLWDNIKSTNICIIWVPKEDGEKGAENLLEEIIAENFLNLQKKAEI